MGIELDTEQMFEASLGAGRQIELALKSYEPVLGGLKNFAPKNTAVLGMGGSAMTAEILKAAIGGTCKAPLEIVRSWNLPASVGPETLSVAISFSGNTKETLASAEAAFDEKALLVCAAAGGKLKDLAKRNSLPFIQLDGSPPMPRAALYSMFTSLALLFKEAGFYPDADKELSAAAAHLSQRAEELAASDSPARLLAQKLNRSVTLIMGASGTGSAAARRFKAQINENAKAPAFYSEIPEAGHNELVGWGQHGDITRQVFSLVLFRSDYEPEPAAAVFPVMVEMMDEVIGEWHEIRAQGENILTQVLDLALFGDFVSLYMADLAGVDPGPIPVIDELKERLAH